MTRKLVGKEEFLGVDEITPDEKKFTIDLTPVHGKKKNSSKKREKLDKAGVLRIMIEKGKDSVDPDHEALIKYIFPKNDLTPNENRNKNYTRKRIKTAIDLILAHCEVYPKKDVK